MLTQAGTAPVQWRLEHRPPCLLEAQPVDGVTGARVL